MNEKLFWGEGMQRQKFKGAMDKERNSFFRSAYINEILRRNP